MFATKSFIVFATCLLIQTKCDEGNVHLFKDEISKAMEYCGETKEARESAKIEFDKRASTSLRHKRENEPNFYEDSEDWEYDDGNKGKSWRNPKDDKDSADSVYGHDRRNGSRGDYGFPRSVQDQNSTKTGQRYAENNFDSRGGRLVPDSMMGNGEDREKNYYKDNESNSYYSNGKKSPRKKRNSALMKSSSDNEVLYNIIVRVVAREVQNYFLPSYYLFLYITYIFY